MTAPRRPGTGSEAHPDAHSPGVPGSQVAVRILGATAVVLAVAPKIRTAGSYTPLTLPTSA